MKCMVNVTAAGMMILAATLFTGCSPHSDVTGSYTTVFDAHPATGTGWRGSADILLTQVGSSVTGNLTLHHPVAGTFQIPITSGTVQDGKVVFFGHANLAFGTVDLSFHGTVKQGRIEGGATVDLQCLFGEENDSATLRLAAATV